MARKYIKLQGHEKPTAESERRAKAFMRWYSLRFDRLRKEWLYAGKFDDEVATDTALYIYECIALKGLIIKGKYKWYFLRSYHMRLLAEQKKRAAEAKRTVYLDEPAFEEDLAVRGPTGGYQRNALAASDFDYEYFEAVVDAINNEMLAYVREKYSPLDASLFEIYMALQPDMSYKRMGKMLGYSPNKIWPVIGAIRRDLAVRFDEKRTFLLSIV